MLKHSGCLYLGFIRIDTLYVLTHQWLALCITDEVQYGCKVCHCVVRVVNGRIRRRNVVIEHTRGNISVVLVGASVEASMSVSLSYHGALALEDV